MLKSNEFYCVKHRGVIEGYNTCVKMYKNGAFGLSAYCPIDGTKLTKFISKDSVEENTYRYGTCGDSRSNKRPIQPRKSRKCKYGRSKSTGKCYKKCKSGERRNKKTGQCKKKPCKYGRSRSTGLCKKK